MLGVMLLASCNQASGKVQHEPYSPLPDFEFTKFNYVYVPSANDVYTDYEITKAPIPTERPSVKTPIVKPSVRLKEAPRTSEKVAVVSKSAAQKFARSRLGDTQYSCVYKLWMRESGWRWNALNRNSGAYGIPQALPGSKMASAGDDWKTNPITQVKWGIRYVNGRYGSACGAWNHFQRVGWY
jgi:hypothetical protein